jgi:hypothetical protein
VWPYFLDRVLPGLITSAIAIFGFNTLQGRMFRRDLRDQTNELKRHMSGEGDDDSSGAGDDGPGGDPAGEG